MFFWILMEAIENVWGNRKKQLSTTIGIAIGICTIILVFFFGKTLENYFNMQYESSRYKYSLQTEYENVLKKQLLEEYQKELSYDVTLLEEYEYQQADIICSNNSLKVDLHFVNHSMFDTDEVEINLGTGITVEKEEKPVCVISDTLYKRLYGNDKFESHKILFFLEESKCLNLSVIGTYKETGNEEEDIAYIPIGYQKDNQNDLDAQCNYAVFVTDASIGKDELVAKTKKFLEKNNIQTYVKIQMDEDNSITDIVLNILSMFMIIVSIICFLIGQMNVLNVMILNVKRRLYEIGIRKAVGARDKDIFIQLFLETIILTFLGFIAGVIIAIIISIISILLIFFTFKNSAIFRCITIPVNEMLLYLAATIIVSSMIGICPALMAKKKTILEALVRN